MISHPTPRPWFTTEGDLNNVAVCGMSLCWLSLSSIIANVDTERLVFSSTPIAPNATPRDLHNLARPGSQHGLTYTSQFHHIKSR